MWIGALLPKQVLYQAELRPVLQKIRGGGNSSNTTIGIEVACLSLEHPYAPLFSFKRNSPSRTQKKAAPKRGGNCVSGFFKTRYECYQAKVAGNDSAVRDERLP